MRCPKCGAENPDNAQVCRACGAQLLPPRVPSPHVVPRTSQLATAAFVLGILSLFTCGLTAIPAAVLGIVSFILIEKSGGKITGTPFAALGVVIPVLIFFVILWPMFLNVRQKACRMACGTNLSLIGMAMLIYANDYDGQLPRSGAKDTPWAMRIPDWKAKDRSAAYGLAPDGSGGQGSITSCFYLLVKYARERPQTFICRGDTGVTAFNPTDEGVGDRALTELWDFGPDPTTHCSYSYHQPFSLYPLTTSSDPDLAVAADRNPWIESPSYCAKTYPGLYSPYGGREAVKAGNAIQHQDDGQNVLFVDNHVNFEKQPFCGVNDDNIYTYWDGGDIRRGAMPILGASESKDKLDSFLVHDGHTAISVPGR